MTINSEPTQMAPTEMAGVAEAETQATYAWAFDYDGDEFPTQPTQRLTPRRITALALAISLVFIAVAGAVMLPMARDTNQPVAQAPSPSVVSTVVTPTPPEAVTAPPPGDSISASLLDHVTRGELHGGVKRNPV